MLVFMYRFVYVGVGGCGGRSGRMRVYAPPPSLPLPLLLTHTHLQPRKKLGVDERRLAIAQPGGHVPRHAEVRVLVDGAGNQARHVLLALEGDGEGGGEGRGGLHGGKGDLAAGVGLGESKDAPGLVVGDELGDAQDGGVQVLGVELGWVDEWMLQKGAVTTDL